MPHWFIYDIVVFLSTVSDIESLANLSRERKYFLTNYTFQKSLSNINTITDGPSLDQCANNINVLDAICKDVCFDLRLLKNIKSSNNYLLLKAFNLLSININ